MTNAKLLVLLQVLLLVQAIKSKFLVQARKFLLQASKFLVQARKFLVQASKFLVQAIEFPKRPARKICKCPAVRPA